MKRWEPGGTSESVDTIATGRARDILKTATQTSRKNAPQSGGRLRHNVSRSTSEVRQGEGAQV